MSQPDAYEVDEDAAAEAHRREVERGATRWAWGIGAGVILVVSLFVWLGNKPSAPTDDEIRSDATRACQETFIPQRLKAPATAKFSSTAVTFDGTAYRVTGSVDSQNSFGALVRSSFTCVMRSTGDTWTLDSASVS